MFARRFTQFGATGHRQSPRVRPRGRVLRHRADMLARTPQVEECGQSAKRHGPGRSLRNNPNSVQVISRPSSNSQSGGTR